MTNSLIQSADWLTPALVESPLLVRLMLLDDDVRSVQIAYRDYSRLRDSILVPNGEPLNRLPELFHHAKSFVCAVRRVTRLMESLFKDQVLPATARNGVKLAWRKKQALLTSYTEPRNAIEHIDGELSGKANWVLMNIVNDALLVTDRPDHRAPIAENTVAAVLSLREDILSTLHPGAANA